MTHIVVHMRFETTYYDLLLCLKNAYYMPRLLDSLVRRDLKIDVLLFCCPRAAHVSRNKRFCVREELCQL